MRGAPVLTKVEHEMAQRDKDNSGRCTRSPVDSVVHSACDNEEYSEGKKRDRQPQPSGDAISSDDEADTAGYRGDGHCQQVLFGLLQ